ncbi:heat shock cognate 70 [Flagelloscypha sp. PMI_526]|nr:heat shock cognate 70 [Flagelloscypha sp. PMI_526]
MSKAIGIDLGTYFLLCWCLAQWTSGNHSQRRRRTDHSFLCLLLRLLWTAHWRSRKKPGFYELEEYASISFIHCLKFHDNLINENRVFNVKRLIGKRFDDDDLTSDFQAFPVRAYITSGVRKELSAEEISALVLMKLKEMAESFLHTPVTHAVISVPSSFNFFQRQAVKNAAAIAGLEVLRLVNESTAAAVAYGLHRPSPGERNILIFDLGGGSTHATLLTLEGIFDVKAHAGNSHLGGEDFDTRLVNYFVREFHMKHGRDISSNHRSLRRLRAACERAKRMLSSAARTSVEIDALFDGIDLYTTLTRTTFEELCQDLFRSTLEPLEKVFRDAHMDKFAVQEIGLNQDEAVATGASVQAAILSGDTSSKLQELLVLDVASHTLGFENEGGVMTGVLKRNTTIPTKKLETISTAFDNQTNMVVRVYEGERARTSSNIFLGQFELLGIPPAPRGVPQIEIMFDIDANEKLIVSATEKTAFRSNGLTVGEHWDRNEEKERTALFARYWQGGQNPARVQLEGYANGLRDSLLRLLTTVDDTISWIETTPNASNEEYAAMSQKLDPIARLFYGAGY